MTMPQLSDQALGFHKAGKLKDAERLYLQILADDPASFVARHLLGVLRHQQGRHAEALEWIEAALADNPDIAEALSNYGAVLKTLGRLDEALAAYDKALAIKPQFADAWNGRGAALSDLNRFAEALADYDAALAIRPDCAATLANRGLVYQYLGKLDAARADFERALTLEPGRAHVYLDYADLGPVAADDPYFKAMRTLRDSDITDNDALLLDFALGKAHADQKDHARSFQHLLRGNALKRSQIVYDEAAMLSFFERIQACFTPELMREKETLGGGAASAAPIFILGMMRSGSTLVEQILASHPAVHGGGELAAFGESLNPECAATGLIYPECVSLLDAGALGRIGARYLDKLQALSAAHHITDKMPTNYFFAGLIHLALPQARIIHTVRDPVDTCVSCFSKMFTREQHHTYDLAELGRYYRHYQALMAHWQRVLPPGRILEVAYEDVVTDLEGQARRLVAYCGLEWDARCLSFHTAERPVRTASVAQVRQRIYGGAVGRARAYEQYLAPLRDALGRT